MPAQSAFHQAELSLRYPINSDFTNTREIIPLGGFPSFEPIQLAHFLSEIDDLFEGGDPSASASAVRSLLKRYLHCDGSSFAFRMGRGSQRMRVYFEPAHDQTEHTGMRELDIDPTTVTGYCLWKEGGPQKKRGYGIHKVTNVVQQNLARPQDIEKEIDYRIYSQAVVCVREKGEAFAAVNLVNKMHDSRILIPTGENNYEGFTFTDGAYLWLAAQVMQPHIRQWARQLGYLD